METGLAMGIDREAFQYLGSSNKWPQSVALYRDMGAGRSLRKLAKDLELNP